MSFKPSPDKTESTARALARAFALAAAVAIVVSGGVPARGGEEDFPEPVVPVDPAEVDFGVPSQEAFRDWPPAALLERAHWLPWSPLSFLRAQLFNRPILLVMTVSWNRLAQRMEEETLRDPKVLRAMNEGYIALLVDADRRPDLRARYQVGTWPVLALLLPNGKPILSQANPLNKALPITAGALDSEAMLFLLREGQIYYERWFDLLYGVGEHWAKQQGEIEGNVPGPVRAEASETLARWLLGNADRQDGGFGAAPKFIVAGLAEYAGIRTGQRDADDLAEHVRFGFERLIAGPLYDSRDGGVHRIATAPGWGGIQYEKMLDGNAQLVRELVFALRSGPSETLRAALRGTCSFLTTVLATGGGVFYLAQQADPTSPDGSGYWTRPPGEARRPPPLSGLVLAGENALAGAALLRAGALLADPDLEAAGKAALDLVLSTAYEPGRGVAHAIEVEPERARFLTTQADAAFGFVDAYESAADPRYLATARDIADFALNNLGVAGKGPLRDHLPERAPLGTLDILRQPMPDNVRMARVLVRLAAHGAGESYRERALAILGAYAGDLAGYGVHGVEAALAVEEAIRPPLRVRIEGPRNEPATRSLRRAAIGLAHPWVVVDSVDQPGRPPRATLSWQGATVKVQRAENLEAEAARLLTPKGKRR